MHPAFHLECIRGGKRGGNFTAGVGRQYIGEIGKTESFKKELEERKLKYIGGIAKNRNILFKNKSEKTDTIRIDEYAQWLSNEEFKKI